MDNKTIIMGIIILVLICSNIYLYNKSNISLEDCDEKDFWYMADKLDTCNDDFWEMSDYLDECNDDYDYLMRLYKFCKCD